MSALRQTSPFAKGVLCILASAFGFAAMSACVRLADDFGAPIPAVQKSFFRNAVAFAIAFALFMRADDRRALWRFGAGAWAVLFMRSAFGTLGIVGNFYAVSHMPLGDAAMLNKLSPFFAVLFSWIFIRERLRALQAVAIAGAFAGAMCVVKPTFAVSESLPALVGFGAGVAAGAAYACVRALGVRKVDARVIILTFSAFSTLAALPFIALDFRPMTARQLLVLSGAGAAAALGQFGITAAYRHCAPRRLAAYDYSNVVFAAVFGFLLFGQTPDAVSWLGFVLIVAMALLVNRSEAKS